MEKFASKIKVGDKLNMHCDGWKIVKSVWDGFMIEVTFKDGSKYSFGPEERVFAV